jgi:hypothetical protein
MNSRSDERNPVEALAEEFLERKRRGEKPSLREYVDAHPHLAAEIRELFPALVGVVVNTCGRASFDTRRVVCQATPLGRSNLRLPEG